MALTQQDKEEMYEYILSRGQSIAGLPEGEATLTNKYLGPVIEYGSGGASGRLVRLAVSLLQGKPAMLRNEGGLIQWAVQGTNAWETLFNISELRGADGEDGKNPVFRKNGVNLEYKIDGSPDTAYQTLIALSEITGPEGDHIVLEVRDGAIMYKQSKAPDSDFQTVFFLADVKGDKGDTGAVPVLESGTVTTGAAGTDASAELVADGQTEAGVPRYRLNMKLPQGLPGEGRGNVYVDGTNLSAGEKYLFTPTGNGVAEGAFAQYVPPVIPTKTSELANDSEFITKAVNDLANYYLKSETYTREEVRQLLTTVSVDLTGYYTKAETDNTFLKKSEKDSGIYDIPFYLLQQLTTSSTSAEIEALLQLVGGYDALIEGILNAKIVISGVYDEVTDDPASSGVMKASLVASVIVDKSYNDLYADLTIGLLYPGGAFPAIHIKRSATGELSYTIDSTT